jgi:hypothetical protein
MTIKLNEVTSEAKALQFLKEKAKESKLPNYKVLEHLTEKEAWWLEQWDKLNYKQSRTDLSQGEINDLIGYTYILLAVNEFRKYLETGKNYSV